MKLTPLDIHHKEFRNSLRGYNAEEVDAFLDEVADEFERLFKENIDLSEKLDVANERVRSYSEIEKTLHNTMLAAQSSAEDIKARAEKEADSLLRDAEIKAKELIQAALSDKQRAQADMMRVKGAEEDFRRRFRSMLDEHLRLLVDTPIDVDLSIFEPDQPAEVAPEVAPMPEAAPADDDFAPPAFMHVTEAQPTAPRPIPPFAPDIAAAEAAEADSPSRPQARVARRADGSTQPMPLDEPPGSGFVQALTLGEMEGPDVRDDGPLFEEPGEFGIPRRGMVGERDDGDIEEID
jgi:cell division initiation protein